MKSSLLATVSLMALACGSAEAAAIISTASGLDATPVGHATIPRPAGAAQGDTLVIAMVTGPAPISGGFVFTPDPGPVTPPAGFTAVDNTTFGQFQADHFAVFVKKITASEPTSYTFSWADPGETSGNASPDQWVALVISGAQDGAAKVVESDADFADPTPLVAGPVSPTHVNDVLVCVWGVEGNDPTLAPPAGMASLVDSPTGSTTLIAAAQSLASAGSTGTRTITSTSTTGVQALETSRSYAVAFH